MRHIICGALCLFSVAWMANDVRAGPGGYSSPASSFSGGGNFGGGGYYGGGGSYSTYYGAPVYSSWGTGGLVYPSWSSSPANAGMSSQSYYPAFTSGYSSYSPSTTYTPTYGNPYTNSSYYNGRAYGWPLPTSAYSYSYKPR